MHLLPNWYSKKSLVAFILFVVVQVIDFISRFFDGWISLGFIFSNIFVVILASQQKKSREVKLDMIQL